MEVGSTFINKVGAIYTVVGLHKRGHQNKDIYYHLSCSKCSEDKELYPRPFVTIRSNLMKGAIPCGCSKSYRWDKEQYKVLLERRCKETMNRLKGFQEWNTYKTRVNLQCNIHKETFSATVETFLKKDIRCKKCNILFRSRRSEDCHIDEFLLTGKFKEGTVFCRDLDTKDSKGYHSHWKVRCPLCYNDEYSINGLCSGIFTAIGQSLKREELPCRCSNKFLWSKEQRQYQIQKALSEEGLDTSIEWVDDFNKKKSNSKFRWLCSEGHTNETSVSKFINSGNRCRRCNKSHNGYYPHRSGEIDYLYIIRLPDGIYKLGRSFVLEVRYKNINKEFKREEFKKYPEGLSVVKEYTGTHNKVFEAEQDILLELENKGMRVYKNWTTETFNEAGLSYVLEYLTGNKDLTLKEK